MLWSSSQSLSLCPGRLISQSQNNQLNPQQENYFRKTNLFFSSPSPPPCSFPWKTGPMRGGECGDILFGSVKAIMVGRNAQTLPWLHLKICGGKLLHFTAPIDSSSSAKAFIKLQINWFSNPFQNVVNAFTIQKPCFFYQSVCVHSLMCVCGLKGGLH